MLDKALLLSAHLFNICSEQIMGEALKDFVGSVKVGGRDMQTISFKLLAERMNSKI